MECTVCLVEWNSEKSIPRLLFCGHSFCENCLKLLYKPATKTLTCPSCLTAHPFESQEDLKKLIKNFSLLSLVATAKPTPKGKELMKSNTVIYNSRESMDKNLNELEDEERKSEGATNQKENLTRSPLIKQEEQKEIKVPQIKYNQKCSKHNLIIHSFVRATQELLCTKCIYEKNLPANQLEIVPTVIRDIKQSIESTRIMILYRRNQLYQALKYLQRMQKGNREVIESKLNEHFSKIRKVVDQFQEKAKSQLDDLMEQQNQKVSAVQTQIEENLDKLYNDDLNLSSLESHDDNEIIYMTNIIDDQKQHLINFKPEIELEDVSIALQLRESVYDKVDNLLSTTCNILLDHLRFDDESIIKFAHILEKDRSWICVICNKKIGIEKVICEECQVFRPLEMYKNLLHNPMNANDEEIEALQQRREKEKQIILEKDSDLNQKGNQQIWYMISSEWLYQWKCFISNKIQQEQVVEQRVIDNVRISENQKIGVLPPGPISNDDLFEKLSDRDFQIKKNLKLNSNYRSVNKEVWEILCRFYGGGPAIVRDQENIYGKDISKEIALKNKGAFFEIIAPLATMSHKDQGKQLNNIFAKKDLSDKNQKKKKRNLFISENILLDDDDGIPEEHSFSGMNSNKNVNKEIMMQKNLANNKSTFLSQKVESLFNSQSSHNHSASIAFQQQKQKSQKLQSARSMYELPNKDN